MPLTSRELELLKTMNRKLEKVFGSTAKYVMPESEQKKIKPRFGGWCKMVPVPPEDEQTIIDLVVKLSQCSEQDWRNDKCVVPTFIGEECDRYAKHYNEMRDDLVSGKIKISDINKDGSYTRNSNDCRRL